MIDCAAAARRTLMLVAERAADHELNDTGPCSWVHFLHMLDEMEAGQDYGKACRWIGYIQGVAVARGYVSLDEAKEINLACKLREGTTRLPGNLDIGYVVGKILSDARSIPEGEVVTSFSRRLTVWAHMIVAETRITRQSS